MSGTETNLPLWLAFLSLNEQATRDWLTGLRNRRYFEEALADHIEAANRYKRDLTLVLFDIDNFKQINDTHGHAAGDEVLRQFAALLTKTARKADIICRHGGDEFAAILSETGKEDAQRFIERVAERLAGSALAEQRYSVSSGIADLPSNDLMAEADSDLLARKQKRA
jgi:diguanylate cyclase (GGDEF)-like protein